MSVFMCVWCCYTAIVLLGELPSTPGPDLSSLHCWLCLSPTQVLPPAIPHNSQNYWELHDLNQLTNQQTIKILFRIMSETCPSSSELVTLQPQEVHSIFPPVMAHNCTVLRKKLSLICLNAVENLSNSCLYSGMQEEMACKCHIPAHLI